MSAGRPVPELYDAEVMRSAWSEMVASAERNNEPGKFTTFIGYEYTSAPDMQNLHRNVIFRSGKAPEQPFTALDSQNPEDLWRWLDARRAEGIEALAIPHNSNGSNGQMFKLADWAGNPFDAGYADLRMRNEPLVEISQVKGTSETHPMNSPNDEWAGFQIFPFRIATRIKSDVPGSYVREALLHGLEMEEKGGFNPFRFGFIGASDTHVAGGPFEESNYWSKAGAMDGTPQQRGSVPLDQPRVGGRQWRRSTRTATTTCGDRPVSPGYGPRRTRATRSSTRSAARRPSPPAGRASACGSSAASRFPTDSPRTPTRWRRRMRRESRWEAISSAGGAARRGWAEAAAPPAARRRRSWCGRCATPRARRSSACRWSRAGSRAARARSGSSTSPAPTGSRPIPATHRCPDNGATVDVATCKITDGKGAAELRTVWSDPEFDGSRRAFYYLRVLENPTCRWSTWDAIRAGVAPNPKLEPIIQERAWSSPIWYVPAGSAAGEG